ncbi:MAG TPA: triose-phosphate isomerase [Trueperaceae bacterium]|nr:triose-phosphate isomerase [Trueperaceae bacterium]
MTPTRHLRRPLIAGNWKMHKLPSEATAWLRELLTRLESAPHDHCDLLLNVPFTHLAPMAELARGTAVALGAQDLSAFDEGAYTGEVSAAMLRDAGARYVIVGHSERRAYHGEDDALVNAKLARALHQGLVPILCVGEKEDERLAGDAEAVVLRQLNADLDGLELDSPDALVVAYEPIWAIGTGRTATADDAQAMGATIRRALIQRFGGEAGRARVLYGGSMKADNAAELLAREDVDGGLIGGASLDAATLLDIVGSAR